MLPLTPTKLGRYEIVDEIGKGAMGVVYLARDPLIGRLVALKTFRIGYSIKDQEMEQFRARFIREAQSAGILSHPNIVTIHDVVEQSDEGMAFIAMEYVRGTNLKALLQGDQPLNLPFIVEVIGQVADALDYAHAHRVIHRDVKPANILITADNRVKITDFGIARLDTSNLTQEGQLLGTPNYMAPEQIQGRDVDHRADLFALGVVLYEMLTRHKPFQGENLTVVSHRIVYDHFTPPKDYVQNLPPGLEGILARALDKDPAKRYQKAKEMVADLRRVSGSLGGDDLNETQSIVMTGPLVPTPPQGAPLGASWAQATDHGTMATPPSVNLPPPLPPPPKIAAPAAAGAQTTHATRPTVRRGPLVVPGRTILAASAAALVLLAIAAALFGWIWWSTPRAGRDAREDERQSQIVFLVHSGYQFLRAGDPATATRFFRQAEDLATGKQKEPLHALLLTAQKQAAVFGQEVEGQKQVAAYLVTAQQAMDNRRYQEALTAAEAALTLDPGSGKAQEIQTAATAAQNRLQEQVKKQRTQRANREEQAAANPAAPEPAPAETTAAEEPVSQTASLHISFQSDRPGVATIRVHVNKRNVFQRSVGSKGGFLRKGKGGRAEGPVDVQAGDAQIEVWVTPPGEGAQLLARSGNFPGGSSRTLSIHLPASGPPSVSLN
ncbi:MAG TPA: serine/threonine-protein kinase [Thermoanaerobaculia bacterium]|nr:serine/threonine-protein kinase [Thermoanaerobaculia bacterium]